MTKWKVKIPDYFEGWWNTLDTYSSEERARKEYEREDRAKLIRVEEEVVEEKGSLASNEQTD
jgi:hypothetical protein